MRSTLMLSIVLTLASAWASAQPTAFTYQGDLASAGTPASGLYDFRFRLFDAATGGTQIGSQLCADNVPVSAGRFTAPLDFGQAFVSNSPRFIEIEVRQDTGLNCSSAGGFIVLAPRQPVTPAPRAAAAGVANALGSPDGSRPNAVIVDNTGKLGVGTTAPTHTIHIASPEPTLALQDTDSSGAASGQQVGYLSYRDSGNIERGWIGYGSPGDPNLTILNARTAGNIVIRPFFGNVGINTAAPAATLDVGGSGLFSGSLGISGNVGIGTITPSSKLEVRGNIRLGSFGEYFAPAGEENLRIVRGTIDADGTILAGLGYSVTYLGDGTWRITFNTPFSGTPSVTTQFRGAFAPDDDTILTSVTPSNVELRTYRGISGGYVAARFNFIAVGPR